MPASRESCELLRSLVRPPAGAARDLNRLAEQIVDWDSALALAQEHRVLPLLGRRLPDMDNAVPAPVAEKIRIEMQHNFARCMANAVELLSLLREFKNQLIPVMPFKGLVLASSAYGDLSARPAGDIDLMIYFRDLEPATAVMRRRGFELVTEIKADGLPTKPDYFEYQFERPSDGLVVELRWMLELTQPRFRRKLGMDWVWPERQNSLFAGAEIPEIKPEILLPVLCMHGSKHFWSRLIWIFDVAQLIVSRPGLDWQETTRQARKHGLRRSLALGVLLASSVAGIPVPLKILKEFEADSDAMALARHIDLNLFAAPGSVPSTRVPYNFRLLDFTDRARLLFSPEFLRPHERDLDAFPLPKVFHPLYYVLRPIRLLLDRAPRP
jgi:hypothetical protein